MIQNSFNDEVINNVIKCANYYIEHSSTVRETGAYFNISKSQVHIYLSKYLKFIDNSLYIKVKKIIDKNKKECHMRGGLALKNKFLKLNNINKD